MSFTVQELHLIDRMADALHVDDMPVRMLVRVHIARLAIALREIPGDALADIVRALEARQNARVL